MKEKELLRLQEIRKIEEDLYEKGVEYICGIDEAGRGPLAGPVVVASVIMPKDSMIEGVNDSKKVSEKKREKLYEEITKEAISYGVAIIDQNEIDRINILNATKHGLTTSIKELKRENVHSLFTMVLQDTWIFKGTVRENISYAKPDATLEEVEEAARRAQATSFIERLPQKYDTVISSSSGLSEGEKQLISIARVLLMNPDMIILDEATSSLDAVSEKNITAAIAELSTNRTSIVIAHRLQTIVNADAIAVMIDGKIGEIGTHQELMAKKGFYYNLYTSQYK